MTYKEKIISHLMEKGTYSPDLDDEMIDDLIENVNLSRKVLRQIKKEGYTVEYITTSGSRMVKQSPLISIYQCFQRNTHQLSSKLGICRGDRLKLKLIETQKDDEFDNYMKE